MGGPVPQSLGECTRLHSPCPLGQWEFLAVFPLPTGPSGLGWPPSLSHNAGSVPHSRPYKLLELLLLGREPAMGPRMPYPIQCPWLPTQTYQGRHPGQLQGPFYRVPSPAAECHPLPQDSPFIGRCCFTLACSLIKSCRLFSCSACQVSKA